MTDELQKRFFQLKLQELLTDNTRPFPTYIIERERPEILELVRRFCQYSPMMIPYKAGYCFYYVPEGLECQKVVDYGDMYVLVNLN
jgi:hypothetical protein